MNNIETNGDKTAIYPMQTCFNDISQKSIDTCIKIAKLNAINKQLNCNCMQCAIGNNSISKCISNGSYEASTIIVDAFPSEYETFTGAMTDEKGYLLTEVLQDKRQDIYCTTLLKCHIFKNADEHLIKECLDNYFKKEIELIQPKKTILTFSAFQACLKYQIIESVGAVNYFTKIKSKVYNYETDVYVIYDFNNLSEQQRQAFKQGFNIILGCC